MPNKILNSNDEVEADRYLGIDYGKSKVGLAVADSETRIAFVYETLDNDKNFLQKLVEIITKEGVKRVIIGIPTHVNREEVTYEGEKLGKKLKNIVPDIEVEYQNEMFTTKMAQDNLVERGIRGVKRYDDEEAARIILQSWLDKVMEHGS
jgi:putative Holliday junction resolvase